MEHQPKYKEMTTASRQAAFIYLHGRCNEGELERGAMTEAVRLFSITHKAMALFWRKMNEKIDNAYLDAEDVIANTMFFENNRMNRGRRPKWDRTELREAVSMVPMASKKTFIKNMSKAINVPKSTLHYMMQNEGLFCRHTSPLQPHLTMHWTKCILFLTHMESINSRTRSPDTNINDLGFFSALQASYQRGGTPNDESGIIQYVSLAYQEYDQAKINRIWLTLMAVLNLIIEHHGGNDFRLPHIKKVHLK
jgi:hypothetical protein